MAQSKLFFEQALAKDPGYVLALTGLADQYSIDGFYGYIPSLEAAARARKYLKHALTFDDSLSEAHNANAFVQGFFNHAWSEAARAARRAVELSPANVIALVWGALVLAIVGDAEESVAWLERGCLRRSLLVRGRIPLQKRHLRHILGQTRHLGCKYLPRKGLAPHNNSERRKHPVLRTLLRRPER